MGDPGLAKPWGSGRANTLGAPTCRSSRSRLSRPGADSPVASGAYQLIALGRTSEPRHWARLLLGLHRHDVADESDARSLVLGLPAGRLVTKH